MENKNERIVDFKEHKDKKEEEESQLTNEEEREIQDLISEYERYSNDDDYE